MAEQVVELTQEEALPSPLVLNSMQSTLELKANVCDCSCQAYQELSHWPGGLLTTGSCLIEGPTAIPPLRGCWEIVLLIGVPLSRHVIVAVLLLPFDGQVQECSSAVAADPAPPMAADPSDESQRQEVARQQAQELQQAEEEFREQLGREYMNTE
eukprot:3411095-Amphidinium_carterae.1